MGNVESLGEQRSCYSVLVYFTANFHDSKHIKDYKTIKQYIV